MMELIFIFFLGFSNGSNQGLNLNNDSNSVDSCLYAIINYNDFVNLLPDKIVNKQDTLIVFLQDSILPTVKSHYQTQLVNIKFKKYDPDSLKYEKKFWVYFYNFILLRDDVTLNISATNVVTGSIVISHSENKFILTKFKVIKIDE